MAKIRVLLVDDQLLFVESLRTVLRTRARDIDVIGVAANGREAIAVVEKGQPDVVLMDVRMPEMDGVEATRIIHERYPDIPILMLTTFDEDEYVHSALQHGALGYLLKDIPPCELIAAIRATKEGASLVSPSVMQKLIEQHTPMTDDSSFALYRNLSKREREILNLLVQGLENRQIAEHLFIAEQTVKNHVSAIYSKMGVRSRIQAMQIVAQKRAAVETDRLPDATRFKRD